MGEHTVTTEREVKDIINAHIDDAQETLISSFEFTLVKDLYGNDGRVLDGASKSRNESDKWLGNGTRLTYQSSRSNMDLGTF